ncbi:hypothetical protein [Acinetobacter bouvetii]|uniref:GNAT family N-acetyltransferase n=1 Tax=Acinetobacter bouvetii TaxID=202951 RepID=A0A811GC54_9GAMM|nr:hypothetical protein [Acinetobacter bouvetii]CAB1213200.1 hypothetical protein SFB21_1244 [Acinetobacter bouvetii]
MGITETIIDFAKLATEQKHRFFKTMCEFDQQIFPDFCEEEIYNFVYDKDAVSVLVIHYHHKNEIVGQNIIPILKLSLAGNPIFVVSNRAGILPAYRKGNRTLKTAIRIAINHRIRHPTIPLWFVPTVIQPKVYTLFASRSQNFFPRVGKDIPQEYLKVLQLMQQRKQEVSKRREDIFVYPHVMPQTTPKHIQRLRNKATPHSNFFMQHVPDYFDGMGLLCICKLDLKTILETIFNLSFDRHVY